MKKISDAGLKRLPVYLSYLKTLPEEQMFITAAAIARDLKMGTVLVRKDLGNVSGNGRPRTGYKKHQLIWDIENFLGYYDVASAVLVGAGKLGRALLGYQGFEQYGLHILAAFDVNVGNTPGDASVPVYPISELQTYCRENRILIGIITVPAEQTQPVADLLVESGIRAIWCFSPVHLHLPSNVLIQYENMASSLAILSIHLHTRLDGG